MNRISKEIFSSLFILFCSILIVSCNEALPLRADLSDLVKVKISSRYNTIAHSGQAGTIQIFVTITNNTDETLDDVAAMTGTMEVVWLPPKEEERLFDKTRTFKLSPSNIWTAKSFNRLTNRLTLGAGDSVVLSVVWNLKSNDSTYILNYFPWVRDNPCLVFVPLIPYAVPRTISTRQYFMVKADVKIFDRLAVLRTQQVGISHCIMFKHNGEAVTTSCFDFTKYDPCSVIGQ